MNKLGFGCVALTQQKFEKDALDILHTAYDLGINYFDTAPLYGQGYSEKILGKFLKGKRDKLIITTKIGLGDLTERKLPAQFALPIHSLIKRIRVSELPNNNVPMEATPISFRTIDKQYIKKSIEKSLSALKTDFIDNCLLHEALPSFLTDEALEYLGSLKSQKVIRCLGIASGIVNLKSFDLFNNFDILQYEGNINEKEESEIFNKYPGKTHIHHSVLKSLVSSKLTHKQNKDLAGWLLLERLVKHDAKRVLFSTTKQSNLKANLKIVNENINLDPIDLNIRIENALS